MNIDYLYSIINLYFREENDKSKTNMVVVKKDDNVEFKFNMDIDDSNTTSFLIPLDVFEENLSNIVNLYKNNQVIQDEKYDYNKEKDICEYYIMFKNGRKVTFENLSINQLKNIRNYLYTTSLNLNEINLSKRQNIDFEKFQNNFAPAYTGFASFKSILLISLFFLIVLVVSLIYFM